MPLSISTRQISEQPVLAITRRVKRPEISSALNEILPKVLQFARSLGIEIAGPPFTRFIEMDADGLTIQAGWPVKETKSPREGEIDPDVLPACVAAVTTYTGAYHGLAEAHHLVRAWIQEQDLAPAGAAWESYITDPADYPDPADWKTEIFWPVRTANL